MTGANRLVAMTLLIFSTTAVVADCAYPAELLTSTESTRPDQGARLLSWFKEEPSDALVKQLETLSPASPGPGLAVRRQQRWLTDPGSVLIESELVNTGKTAGRAERVGLAEWAFRTAAPAERTRYQLLSHRDDTWYGSTYWTGLNWTRVGRDWQHPGQDTPSVRRFSVPRDGKAAISGRVAKAHLDGDGVRLFIRHNAHTVWQAEIDGKDGKGLEPHLTLDVHKGDSLRFVVHKRGHIYCDTTRWDPVVTYADGQEYRASRAFATGPQGAGGWFYEMETDATAAAGPPTVYAFGLDFGLRAEAVQAGRSVVCSEKDSLPVFVLSDGPDHSGVILAGWPRGAWRFAVSSDRDGRLRMDFQIVGGPAGLVVEPGKPLALPPLTFAAYRGSWTIGFARLDRLLLASQQADLRELRKRVAEAFRRAFPLSAEAAPELDFWAMIQAEWRREDILSRPADYLAAAVRHLEATRSLIAKGEGEEAVRAEQERLSTLAGRPKLNPDEQRALYLGTRFLKRHVLLAKALKQDSKLLFAKRVPTSYSHLVMQYFGWRARPGGGLFVLDKPGRSLAARDLVDGRMATGNVLEPRLSYDAQRIVFSFSRCLPEDPFFHIYEVRTDGSGLRQLSHGDYEDLMPSYLPDGGIIFCSTRRKGHARCFGSQFGPRWHVYTLHRMDADGSNIRTLSYHETNEWFPTVAPSGHILYSRWDYVDRHPVVHQNLWACRPDGTHPVALWGNHTESPHCTFQLQPIPNTTSVVFTASAHHSITGGSIAVVSPNRGPNGEQALTRLTPEVRFPEAEGRINEYYDAPWPLSEDFFLVGYSPKPLIFEPQPNEPAALGIYLLDRRGNRELIYRDPAIGCSNAIPLAARPMPPVLASTLPRGVAPTGELVLTNIYRGLGDISRGRIKALRVIQVLPKTTPVADGPRVGLAGQEPTRAILGTVPVEPDGSARFVVPARKPILFQALDQDGFAYQTMRSITYLQPGETNSCVGCHEHRTEAPHSKPVQALRRPASQIEPGPEGSRPFSYVRLVQPILDRHCVRCHGAQKPAGKLDLTGQVHEGFSRSYWSLCGKSAYGKSSRDAVESFVPRYGGWNSLHLTTPGGTYGARGSRLMGILLKQHADVQLSREELVRIALWIDCNSIFYGVYDPAEQSRQLRGEIVPLPEVQ